MFSKTTTTFSLIREIFSPNDILGNPPSHRDVVAEGLGFNEANEFKEVLELSLAKVDHGFVRFRIKKEE